MRLISLLLATIFLMINQASAAPDPEKIGKAVEVENSVDLITPKGAFEIVIGTDIRTRETVTTGANSSSQFKMSDDTRLAVGPNSQVLLDEFVYDPNPGNRKFVLRGLKGALRFVTGNNPSDTYTINTPTAVIGVRGTMFDIYIDEEGKTVIGLLDGKVNVCPPGSPRCQNLQTPGRFLSIDRQGRIRKADRPDRAMLGNIRFAKAFPFLGGARVLRGKLAAPGKLRQRIRRKAGLQTNPKRKIKRKVNRRKINKRKIVRKPPKRRTFPRHNRTRSNAQNDGNFRPPARHRKIISRYDGEDARKPPRHRKSVSRRQQGDGGYRRPLHRKATSRYRPGTGKRPTRHRKATSRYQSGNGKLRPIHRKSLSIRQKRPKHKKSRSRYQGGTIFPLPGRLYIPRNPTTIPQ